MTSFGVLFGFAGVVTVVIPVLATLICMAVASL
ncbi:MAG: hypothetical protein ACJAQ8_000296 [Haliea salexigens]